MGESDQKVIKPGIMTSEFYLVIATNITGILVLLGYLTPVQADQFVDAVVSVIGGLLTIIATITYLYGRIALKREQIKSSSPSYRLPEGIEDVSSSGNTPVYPK